MAAVDTEAVAMVEAEAVEGLVMYVVVAPLLIHAVKLSGAASKFGNSNYNMVFVIVNYFLVYAI